MRFYDTFTKSVVSFEPQQTVRMYVCGITPYDSAHLGHIFTFMVYDLLQRRLEDQGYSVQQVRNITDVDEPIFKRAGELGVPYMELANQEIEAFQTALTKLNFRAPYSEPRASEYIEEMAAAVQQLLDKGFAYRLEGDVYYDIAKDKAFGELSGYTPLMMRRLMAKRGGDPHRQGKRHPLDFLLWRSVTDPKDTAVWDTVVGHGRPGWHIECTVMSKELLSLPLDIHGGGNDLIFPHHECEIAQARGLGYSRASQHWLHTAPLSLYGEKMSKSLGNLLFAKDLLQQYAPSVIRLALMSYHYRSGGEWRPELLQSAGELHTSLTHALTVVSDKSITDIIDDVRSALDDNLDFPRILQILKDFASQKHSVAKPAALGQRQKLEDLLGLTF